MVGDGDRDFLCRRNLFLSLNRFFGLFGVFDRDFDLEVLLVLDDNLLSLSVDDVLDDTFNDNNCLEDNFCDTEVECALTLFRNS